MNKYDDIINLKRPSSKHPKMSMKNRAAQFSPFAALVGYEDIIDESGREVYDKICLNEQQEFEINNKLVYLIENKDTEAVYTFYKEDTFKDGGAYLNCKDRIKKYDVDNNYLILNSGIKINIEDIVGIEI